jgi:hypothetical protein
LWAAVQVAVRDRIMAMKMDAVAHEADVSKGRRLGYIPSKDVLISAMLDHSKAEHLGQL